MTTRRESRLKEDTRDRDQSQADAQEREEWIAPALTDLGSFEELTEFQVAGPNPDSEGFS